jgi:hypothetical protein
MPHREAVIPAQYRQPESTDVLHEMVGPTFVEDSERTEMIERVAH